MASKTGTGPDSGPDPDPDGIFSHDLGLGAERVAGTDEAGRGCLAGPIVAAAVLFDRDCLESRGRGRLEGLKDSKKLTAKARERLYPEIIACATRVSVVMRSSRHIDANGLHRSNIDCLSGALTGLEDLEVVGTGTAIVPIRLVDGFRLSDCPLDHRKLVGGDRLSASVAAASVVAKVARDSCMKRAGERYPGYGFESHKGYASVMHREAIVTLGPTPIHRLSFASAAYGQAERTAGRPKG